MKTQVNFEIAKLLREKGFNEPCTQLYFDGELKDITIQKVSYDDTLSSRYYIAPTIAEVVMWLYEKHTIWIGVELTDNTREFYFQPTIWTSKDRDFHDEDMIDQAKSICKWKEWQYNSPAEAYEAAITYTLENLIQGGNNEQ